MQKKVLLSSILVIALCLSVIAGSTYALFTDKAQTSVAITSGDVEVVANMALVQTYSAVAGSNSETNPCLVDENGKLYDYQAQAGYTFLNGGYAEVNSDGQVVVHNITPGDKFEAKVIIDNVGNVDMVYRFKISSADSFAKAMVVKVIDASGTVLETVSTPDAFVEFYYSDWATDVVGKNETAYVYLSFELPVKTGNEYQSEDGAPVELVYDITVEAVQGNAVTSNGDNTHNFPGYMGSKD